MIRFIIILLLISFSSNAQTSPVRKVCVDYTSDICIEITFVNTPNTTDEGEFNLMISSPNNEMVQNVKVDLWMQMGSHGHGSAPVQLKSLSNNNYKVENAWFVMKGEWQIRVDFEVAGQIYKLKLPVQI
jgi:nitrogen fixation protein FixH